MMLNKSLKKLRWYILLSLLSMVVYFSFRQVELPWIESMELITLNMRMMIRGEQKLSDQVIIVAIDNRSISDQKYRHQNPWPWKKSVYAALIDKIGGAGARSIVMDIAFESENPHDLEGDRLFAESMFTYPIAIIGTTLINSKSDFMDLPPFYQEILGNNEDYIRFRYRFANPDPYYPPIFFETYKMVPPYSLFMNSAWGYGTFEIGLPDEDGMYHHAMLIMNEIYMSQREKGSFVLLPNIDILGLCAYFQVDSENCVFDMKNNRILIGDYRSVPVDPRGYFAINYYGKRAFPEVSVVDVLAEKNQAKLEKLFANKMVLIGYTANSKGLYDLRPTPFNRNEAGIQIHATLMENILTENYLQRIPYWLNLLIIFIILCLFSCILLLPNLKSSVIWSVVFIIAFNVGNYLCFLGNLWVDLFYPNLVLLILFLQSTIIRVYQENREKLQIKNYFTKYVPGPVVEEILKDPDRIHLGGEKMHITILFSDIVGFTTISEQLDPVELVRLLNEYLTEMTAIIKDQYGGTLDKFIGDAIVAIFGAPFPKSDDPVRAVKAALAMQQKVLELQERWRERGEKFVFGIGVGINTGSAVVGNMGSPDRMNYTCIGDTVNTAARLESSTRATGASILISASTYEAVKDVVLCEELPPLAVKGKKEPLTVYSVLGYKDTNS